MTSFFPFLLHCTQWTATDYEKRERERMIGLDVKDERRNFWRKEKKQVQLFCQKNFSRWVSVWVWQGENNTAFSFFLSLSFLCFRIQSDGMAMWINGWYKLMVFSVLCHTVISHSIQVRLMRDKYRINNWTEGRRNEWKKEKERMKKWKKKHLKRTWLKEEGCLIKTGMDHQRSWTELKVETDFLKGGTYTDSFSSWTLLLFTEFSCYSLNSFSIHWILYSDKKFELKVFRCFLFIHFKWDTIWIHSLKSIGWKKLEVIWVGIHFENGHWMWCSKSN